MKTVAVFTLVTLLALPIAADAQDAYTSADKWVLVEAQLVESLQSPVDNVRTQSLKNAIVFATLYRDQVDLSSAVDAIREVYEDGERSANRKLALAALQAIGGARASAYVARRASTEESNEGRVVLVSVLNEYQQQRLAGPTALR